MVCHGHHVIAGLGYMPALLEEVDRALGRDSGPDADCMLMVADGERFPPGTDLLRVEGPADVVLAFERTALNLMSRMCGIATVTGDLVARCREVNPRVVIAATRKTTPGIRFFEKRAVQLGGGSAHRYGLFDMVLIKDNHGELAGGLAKAVGTAISRMGESGGGAPPEDDGRVKAGGGAGAAAAARALSLAAILAEAGRSSPGTTKDAAPEGGHPVFPPAPSAGRTLAIEVEVRDNDTALEVAALGVDVVMLDNFTPEEAARTYAQVKAAHPGVLVEVSGGLTPDNIIDFAAAADILSVGWLTHSAPGADLSMNMYKLE
jgi:nicotinate-nucleotide pyrophosphorylase (carboxylating)